MQSSHPYRLATNRIIASLALAMLINMLSQILEREKKNGLKDEAIQPRTRGLGFRHYHLTTAAKRA